MEQGSGRSSSAAIRAAIAAHGVSLDVVELPSSTRTAAEAAEAIGCTVSQIAKSIVFRTANTGMPVLVVASGVNRIDEGRIAASLGEPVEKADADFVRAATGFAIGGVPPIGHPQPIPTIVDEDLLPMREVWAAAGTPRSVFRLSGELLLAMTSGQALRVK